MYRIFNPDEKIIEITKLMKQSRIMNGKVTEYRLSFETGENSFDQFIVDTNRMLASYTEWDDVGNSDSISYNLTLMSHFYSFKNRLEERIAKDKENMY